MSIETTLSNLIKRQTGFITDFGAVVVAAKDIATNAPMPEKQANNSATEKIARTVINGQVIVTYPFGKPIVKDFVVRESTFSANGQYRNGALYGGVEGTNIGYSVYPDGDMHLTSRVGLRTDMEDSGKLLPGQKEEVISIGLFPNVTLRATWAKKD